MPNPNITVAQKTGQQFTTGTNNASAQVPYLVTGTDDRGEVFLAVAGEAPPSIDHGGIHYTLNGISVTEEYIGPAGSGRGTVGVWDCSANYQNLEIGPGNAGDPPSYNFTTSGGTQHITTSIVTVQSYALFGTAPDFGGAIGANADAVEGVDVGIREFEWTETHYFTDAQVTVPFLRNLWLATFTTNSAAVNHPKLGTLAAGELLFKGADIVKRGNGQWEGTFRFSASENTTSLMIGLLGPITKKGWEYLWVFFDLKEDTTAKHMVRFPGYAYVEQVYEETNHNALGIF